MVRVTPAQVYCFHLCQDLTNIQNEKDNKLNSLMKADQPICTKTLSACGITGTILISGTLLLLSQLQFDPEDSDCVLPIHFHKSFLKLNNTIYWTSP